MRSPRRKHQSLGLPSPIGLFDEPSLRALQPHLLAAVGWPVGSPPGWIRCPNNKVPKQQAVRISLLASADTLNVRRTPERTNTTQPTLGEQPNVLDDRLGAQLGARSRLPFNPIGEQVAAIAWGMRRHTIGICRLPPSGGRISPLIDLIPAPVSFPASGYRRRVGKRASINRLWLEIRHVIATEKNGWEVPCSS